MNRSSLLHIIEKLERFLERLPATIQKPVKHELVPLKELFLQQRPPRFVLTGANKLPIQEVVAILFSSITPPESRNLLMELFRWQPIEIGDRGTIDLLDARGADAATLATIQDELDKQPADIFLHLADHASLVRGRSAQIDSLAALIGRRGSSEQEAKVVGIILHDDTSRDELGHDLDKHSPRPSNARSKLQEALQEEIEVRKRLLQILEFSVITPGKPGSAESVDSTRFMSLLARELPNAARIEMVRITRDREIQSEVAQMLLKSTTAICAAIGAQPIPLADLPILTTLQLAMVSGIMYISGRERSLRAATEFVGALGVNVGAGMLFRESARALLKFFPGWGNIVCGVVAGAGTYGIGRAAIAYFLDGLSLKDARRTYLTSRKKGQPRLPAAQEVESSR